MLWTVVQDTHVSFCHILDFVSVCHFHIFFCINYFIYLYFVALLPAVRHMEHYISFHAVITEFPPDCLKLHLYISYCL